MATRKLDLIEFLSLWKLTYGFEWVSWLDAYNFRETYFVRRHTLVSLANQGYFEHTMDVVGEATRIRLVVDVIVNKIGG